MLNKGLLTGLFICLGLLSLFAAYGNDSIPLSSKDHSLVFLHLGVSSHWFAVRDKGTSPLTYSGLIPGCQAGVCLQSKKFMADIDYSFAYGYLKNRNYSEDLGVKSTSYSNELNMLFAWRLKPSGNDKTRFYAGADLNTIANFRNNSKFNNASYNYEVFSSVGPALLVEHEFFIRKQPFPHKLPNDRLGDHKWKMSALVFSPVYTAAIRPSYPSIEDYLGTSSKINLNLRGTRWIFLKDYLNLAARIQLFYQLYSGHELRLSYQLYYYDYHPGENRVRGLDESFLISFFFRLTHQ